MSRALKLDMHANCLDQPAGLLRAEQRLAARALRLWRASGGAALVGFEAEGLLIGDPAGEGEILKVAAAIAETFGLNAGQRLALDPALAPGGLGMELRAVCDLVALGGQPVPFEASLQAKGLVLARGIALPVPGDRVQVVMSWREVLNRSATARLKQELGQALAGLTGVKAAARDALPLGRLGQR